MIVEVVTDYPIAFDSPDHLCPWGTMHDNSTDPDFIVDIEQHFGGRKIAFLDLGCAGGQLAVDFYERGHIAVGLEGSDYPVEHEHENWGRYHKTVLFTCDVSRPFQIRKDGEPMLFDCITAWEVTEHIHPDRLDTYFQNVHDHLTADGLFLGSCALFEDDTRGGLQVHQSVFPEDYWRERYLSRYFVDVPSPTAHWVRWSHEGFHHCVMRRV